MATNQKSTGTSESTKTIVTILLLIFVYPVGLIMMWVWTKWKLWVKVLVTVVSLLLALFMAAIFATIIFVAINPAARMQTAQCVRLCGTNDAVCTADCTAKIKEGKEYPEKLRSNFITACTNSGGVESSCTCVLDYIETKLSYSEYVSMEDEMTKTGKLPPIITEATDACK